jgi:GTPase-associated system helical domain
MADENILPMRDEFPRWYRLVDATENRARLDARWAGVSSVVHAADSKSAETLIALLLKAKSRPTDESILSLREHFKRADDLFQMSDNDRELQVLSGAALATLLDGSGSIAARTALMTSVSFFSGARRADFPFDFVGAAEAAIARISERQRTRPALTKLAEIGRTGLDQATRDKLTKEALTSDNIVVAFDNMAKFSNSVTRDITVKTNAALDAIDTFIAIQDEELQLLWWLFGGRSETLDCPFTDVPADALPIVLAAEAAKATQFSPGPPSVKPILSRAGLKERKKTVVTTAINNCDDGFLRKLVANSGLPSPVTQPLHFAMHRKLEAGDDTSWLANWSAVTEINADLALSGIELGNFFYRERLGVKFGS